MAKLADLADLVHGRAAADLLGVARPDAVWRAVDLHGAAYPGALQVIEVGKAKAARRDQLAGFARWYQENVRAKSSRWAGRQPGVVGDDDETAAGVAEVEDPADLDARRAALREAISFIREVTEDTHGTTSKTCTTGL